MNKVNFGDDNIPGENIEEKVIEKENEMKTWLVEYVGDKKEPENNEVTVGLIVETMAEEFPEFLLAVAEENWIRGYQQAVIDSDAGKEAMQTAIKNIDDSKTNDEE